MKPITIIRIVLLILIVIGLGALATYQIWVPQLVEHILRSEDLGDMTMKTRSPLNATYIINGESITLKDGKYEVPIANSTSKVVVPYFGNAASGDLNGDGSADLAFIITESTGGTGVFYYVVAGLNSRDGYQGINAVFIGDRIAPQSTEVRDGVLIVNYADRAPGESYVTEPSIGKSMYLIVRGTNLEKVVGIK